MKLSFTTKNSSKVLALGIAAALLWAQPALAIGKPVKTFGAIRIHPRDDDPAKKSKAKAKSFASLNNAAVKIYPDPVKRMMHVVAKENAGKDVDFFVFDLQGALVQNYKMKSKDHVKIEGLQRGSYVYRVFTGDEETASGNFQIR